MQEKNSIIFRKISVCIPAYNRPEYLVEAIKSVIDQKYKNFELIISDDNSPINLESIVNNFRDPRIIYYRQNNNLGFIKNWNFCLSKASGDYIKIMGDDDILLPDCLEKSVLLLDNENGCDLFCSNYFTIDGLGEIIDNKKFNIDSFRFLKTSGVIFGEDIIKRYFLGKLRIGLPSAIIFRRSVLSKIGLFDDSIGSPADIDFWLRIARDSNIYYHDEPLLKMRWHENNLSKKLMKDFFCFRNDLLVLYKNVYVIKDDIKFREKILIYLRYFAKILINFFDKRAFLKDNFYLLNNEIFKLFKIIWFK